jgi:hypothetical protein
MTSWVRAGPTFTLATDRLAESEAGNGDGDLQPAKLAMRIRFPSPAPRRDQLVSLSVQLSRASGLLTCLSKTNPCLPLTTVSMAFSEGLSDTGDLTGRGRPYVRGAITGAGTFLGGIVHTLPFLIPRYGLALPVAVATIAVELLLPAWIRWRFFATPFLRSFASITLGRRGHRRPQRSPGGPRVDLRTPRSFAPGRRPGARSGTGRAPDSPGRTGRLALLPAARPGVRGSTVTPKRGTRPRRSPVLPGSPTIHRRGPR